MTYANFSDKKDHLISIFAKHPSSLSLFYFDKKYGLKVFLSNVTRKIPDFECTTRVLCQRTGKNFNDIMLELNNFSFLHPIKIFIFSMIFLRM